LVAVPAKVITVNLVGTFNMIRLAADGDVAKNEPEADGRTRRADLHCQRGGLRRPNRASAAYSASKGGVVGMTLPIARDLARSGIRNMTIAPGIFGTPMLFSNASGGTGRAGCQRALPQPPGHAHKTTRSWCTRSSSTTCSTAKSSAWTARSASHRAERSEWPRNPFRVCAADQTIPYKPLSPRALRVWMMFTAPTTVGTLAPAQRTQAGK
jgi:NAD(P)-dependent dehydrogenase (short-subunit alcohol dehydrogenase family)